MEEPRTRACAAPRSLSERTRFRMPHAARALSLLALGLMSWAGCTLDVDPSPPRPADDSAPLAQPAPPKGNPVGSGETASATIDNAVGGSVGLSDGTRLDIPPGALPPGVDTITVTSATEPAPAVYEAISPLYVFEPDGTVFLKPIKITIPISLPSGVSPSELTVLWSRARGDGFDMVPTEIVRSGSGHAAIGEVTHFSEGMCGKKFTVDPRPAPDPYGD